MEPILRELRLFENENGHSPFLKWLDSIKNLTVKSLIRKRLNRVRLGNLGNTRSLGDKIYELKIDSGPGYRIYFGTDGSRIIVLLIGGDKSSQNRDIQKAKLFWKDYNG